MRERKMAEVLFGAREVFFRCGYEGATVDAIATVVAPRAARAASAAPTEESASENL